MSKRILLAAAGAAAAVVLGALVLWPQRPERPPSATSGASVPASAAEVATVELREVADLYAADAVIEAVRAATVSAQIAGNVTRFYVDAGERVKRGDLLVRIDTRDTDAQVAAGAARVAQAEAQLAQAQLDHARTRRLVEQKFVSQAAFDKAEADLQSARAGLEVARAGASRAATNRSFAEVRSPIDGVVTRRLAELGELAAPGRPLLEVHDPSALRAVAAVPQFVLARVAAAREAEVSFPALGVTLRAKSVAVLPAADARLLSTQVRAELPAALPAGGVPGIAAKVLLGAGTAKRLVVPESAILRRGELTAALVIGADGRARLRQVRVGEPAGGGLVEVLAGLDAGERVELQ